VTAGGKALEVVREAPSRLVGVALLARAGRGEEGRIVSVDGMVRQRLVVGQRPGAIALVAAEVPAQEPQLVAPLAPGPFLEEGLHVAHRAGGVGGSQLGFDDRQLDLLAERTLGKAPAVLVEGGERPLPVGEGALADPPELVERGLGPRPRAAGEGGVDLGRLAGPAGEGEALGALVLGVAGAVSSRRGSLDSLRRCGRDRRGDGRELGASSAGSSPRRSEPTPATSPASIASWPAPPRFDQDSPARTSIAVPGPITRTTPSWTRTSTSPSDAARTAKTVPTISTR
jgi:hypothetical protein